MIDEITISGQRGNLAICKGCRKKIKYLKVRGVQKAEPYNSYYCKKCAKGQLETGEDKIRDMKKEFKRISEMNVGEKEDYLQRIKLLKQL